jgi:hypothetical protein
MGCDVLSCGAVAWPELCCAEVHCIVLQCSELI